jgi:hypothetical protein
MTYVTVIVPGVYNDPNHRNHPFAEAGEVIQVASGGYADSLIADGFVSLANNPTAVRVTNPLRPPHELPFTVLDNLDGHTHLAAGERLYLRFPVPDGCYRGMLHFLPVSQSYHVFRQESSGAQNSYPPHLPFYARNVTRSVVALGATYVCFSQSLFVDTEMEQCTSISVAGTLGDNNGQAVAHTYTTGRALLGFYWGGDGTVALNQGANQARQVVECAWVDPTAQELIISIQSLATTGGPFALVGEVLWQW